MIIGLQMIISRAKSNSYHPTVEHNPTPYLSLRATSIQQTKQSVLTADKHLVIMNYNLQPVVNNRNEWKPYVEESSIKGENKTQNTHN